MSKLYASQYVPKMRAATATIKELRAERDRLRDDRMKLARLVGAYIRLVHALEDPERLSVAKAKYDVKRFTPQSKRASLYLTQ